LILGALGRIEALGVDYVYLIHGLEGDSFRASASIFGGVEDWQGGVQEMIEEGGFAWGLGAEDADV